MPNKQNFMNNMILYRLNKNNMLYSVNMCWI